MRCPVCGGTNIEQIEDGYRCRDCGYSETPIGWNDTRSQMWYYRHHKEEVDKILEKRRKGRELKQNREHIIEE